MFLFITLVALAVAGIVGTLRALPTDGYRQLPTDPTRLP